MEVTAVQRETGFTAFPLLFEKLASMMWGMTMKCEHCPQRLSPDWKYCPCCGQEIIVNPDDRLSSGDVQYFPDAFEPAAYNFGRTVAEDSAF